MAYQNATPTVSGSEVVDVSYAPTVAGLPVESFLLSSLLERQPNLERSLPQRLDFDLLLCATAGSGSHEVDFEPIEVHPGRILHVRPGQVHRWILDPPYEAQLFLLRPLDRQGSWRPGETTIDVDVELGRDIARVAALADPERRSSMLSVRSLEAVRDLLIGLLGLRDRPRPEATGRELIYDDFQRLLESADLLPRTVAECAQLLQCSTRTLARACHAGAGVEPKLLIDRRMALEAQRRLSEPGRSATQVAASLGFVELSHFTRFFKRMTGETPSAFSDNFASTGNR